MKEVISLVYIIFSGYASYISLDALGVLDLPLSLMSWMIVTGVFVIGGINLINEVFPENSDDGQNNEEH